MLITENIKSGWPCHVRHRMLTKTFKRSHFWFFPIPTHNLCNVLKIWKPTCAIFYVNVFFYRQKMKTALYCLHSLSPTRRYTSFKEHCQTIIFYAKRKWFFCLIICNECLFESTILSTDSIFIWIEIFFLIFFGNSHETVVTNCYAITVFITVMSPNQNRLQNHAIRVFYCQLMPLKFLVWVYWLGVICLWLVHFSINTLYGVTK